MNRLPLLLAALAVLVTSMVPSGFMAAQAQDGSIVIRICGGASGKDMILAEDDPLFETFALIQQQRDASHGKDKKNGDDDKPCDMGTGPFSAPPLTQIVARDLVHPVANFPAILPLTGIFPSGLPPSTGPPVF